MGSGHLSLRKTFKAEINWKDKTASKHKCSFNRHYILKEISPNGMIYYYNVMKCDKCLSFRSISAPGNIQGFISKELTTEQEKIPKLVGYKKHNYKIGFYDLERVLLDQKDEDK